MSKYSFNIKINNYDCDSYGKLSSANLVKYLGEAALQHSIDSGDYAYSVDENDKAWMIYKWRIEILDDLRAGDAVDVQTWISRLYKFYANREYLVYSEDKLVARVSSLWIYIDTKRKFPSRIPKDLEDIYTIDEEYIFKDFIELDEKLEGFLDEFIFSVRKSDIDYNKHVNNANYIDWMMELIPLEIEENYKLSKVNVTYKQEVLYNEDIVSKIKLVNKEKDALDIEHRIYGSDGSLRTLGHTSWRR